MKIDTTKIAGYEDMSAEEKLEAILNAEIDAPKPDNSAEQRLKDALNKASSEAAEYKKQLREKQSEAERAEAERAERDKALQDELNALRRDKDVAAYKASFLSIGYGNDVADESAKALADGDYQAMFAGIAKFLTLHDKELDEKRVNGMSAPQGGSATKEITREQFNSMGYSERVKLYDENPELYEQLSQGE